MNLIWHFVNKSLNIISNCDIVSSLTMSPYDELLRRNMNIFYYTQKSLLPKDYIGQ